MDARAHARIRFALPVSLYCTADDRYYLRKTANISLGGLFVNGEPCGGLGKELYIIINPVNQQPAERDRYASRIVRRAMGGFALQFNPLGERESRSLEEVIRPTWDGENMYEGLLMIAAQEEEIADLAGYLRLTSLVSNQYRRLCRKVPDKH